MKFSMLLDEQWQAVCIVGDLNTYSIDLHIKAYVSDDDINDNDTEKYDQ